RRRTRCDGPKDTRLGSGERNTPLVGARQPAGLLLHDDRSQRIYLQSSSESGNVIAISPP
ncbi:MAG: hypothetical protein ACMUIG_04555, partial [Thermoplasmatota archaeon]